MGGCIHTSKAINSADNCTPLFLPPKHERTQDNVKVENQDITPGGHEQHDFGGDIIVDFVAVRPLQKPSEPLRKSLSHVLKKKKQRGLSLTQQFRDTPLDLPVILPQFGIDEDLEGRQCTYPGELLARGPDGSLSPVIIPPNNLRASSSKSSELLREPNSISSQPDLSSQPDSSCYVSEDSDPSLKEKSESCLSGDHETPKDPETPEKKSESCLSGDQETSKDPETPKKSVPAHQRVFTADIYRRMCEFYPGVIELHGENSMLFEETPGIDPPKKGVFIESENGNIRFVETPEVHDAFLRNMSLLIELCTCCHCETNRKEHVCFAFTNAVWEHTIDLESVYFLEFSKDRTHVLSSLRGMMKNLPFDHQIWRFDVTAHCFLLRVKKVEDQLFVQMLHSWANTFPASWWVGLSERDDTHLKWREEYWIGWREKIGHGKWILYEDFWNLFFDKDPSFDIPWLDRNLFWDRVRSVDVGKVQPKFELPFC